MNVPGLKRGAAFGHVVDLPSTADVHVEDKGGVQTGLGVQRAGERIADSVDVPLGCEGLCNTVSVLYAHITGFFLEDLLGCASMNLSLGSSCTPSSLEQHQKCH